jgi:hypothetical protein
VNSEQVTTCLKYCRVDGKMTGSILFPLNTELLDYFHREEQCIGVS